METLSRLRLDRLDKFLHRLVWIDDKVIPKKTTDEKVLLMKDLDGDPCQGSFGYAIMVGMMLHLTRHMKLGISIHGHAASRFNFCPKRSHDIGLEQIGI